MTRLLTIARIRHLTTLYARILERSVDIAEGAHAKDLTIAADIEGMDATRLTDAQKVALAPFLAALAAQRAILSIDNARVSGTIAASQSEGRTE